jgi:hypothetical protein
MEKISYLSYSDSASAFYHLSFIIYHLSFSEALNRCKVTNNSQKPFQIVRHKLSLMLPYPTKTYEIAQKEDSKRLNRLKPSILYA